MIPKGKRKLLKDNNFICSKTIISQINQVGVERILNLTKKTRRKEEGQEAIKMKNHIHRRVHSMTQDTKTREVGVDNIVHLMYIY